MMRNKKIVLVIAILFAFIFSSFAAKKEKAAKQSKPLSSEDFVYFEGIDNESYVIRHVGFDFTAFLSGGKNLSKILDFGKPKGYSVTTLSTGDGVKDSKTLLILCNIFSEMDGLEPAYKKMDGSPVKSEADLKEFIYTAPACGGWYLPTISDFRLETIYERPKSPATRDFEEGCGAWQYYHSGKYGSSYMSMGFSMKRSVSAQGKVVPVKNMPGIFKDDYYFNPFEIAIIDSATLVSVFISMAKNGYSVGGKKIKAGDFVGANGKLSVRDLGISDEIFCNMLSEAMGYVPVYYDYDGNVYKKDEGDNYNRKYYEQHTNGWRKPTSKERSLIEKDGIKGIYFVRNNER